MTVVLLVLAVLLAVAIGATIVSALRHRTPWPRKPHLGHWRKWDDEDD